MVVSSLRNEEKRYINELLRDKRVGELVSLTGIDTRLIGVPSVNSLPALIGYVKDGYRCIDDYFFPQSFGALFIK
jgi:hypothetical protein